MRSSILSFEAINERLCKLRLKGKFRNLSLVCAYAPTDMAGDADKEIFYDQLEGLCERIQRNDLLILLGDFNAKIGSEESMKMVAGRFTLHNESNDNGQRLGQMAAKYNMVIKSTCFDHKKIHLGTWKCPGSSLVNQIDHVVVGRRNASNILDVKACRGPNCDSDHFLVKAKVRHRLSNAQKGKSASRIKWNVDKPES